MRCHGQLIRRLILFLAPILLIGCEGTTWSSSVPAARVHVVIDTRKSEFVTFVPTALTDHIIVNKTGVYYNNRFLYLPDATTTWGYGGVVVYIDMLGEYKAFDLCCPNCVSYRESCVVDGLFAICPRCGEEYDLGSGLANPQKGIAKEMMRSLPLSSINYTDNSRRITVEQ